mmetsp:Transcript_2434/g.6823  ORF Transcript_2434/g.6823 Transcript_2434/m.6823 type:complete len:288 (+) Transcript_2434:231-1094(+)
MSPRMPVSSGSSRGPQSPLHIGGGPQTMTRTSSDGGAVCFSRSSRVMKPLRPLQDASKAACESTWVTFRRPPDLSDQLSRSSRQRMSSWALLPKTRLTCVPSPGVPRTACRAWIMGVMPVPPASIVRCFAPNGYCLLTLGPLCLNSTGEPSGSEFRCCDIFPRSYSLITSWNLPSIALVETGVYGRTTGSVPLGSSNLQRTHAHVDRPSGFHMRGNLKVTRIVSCVTCSRPTSVAGLQSSVNTHWPGGQTAAVGGPTRLLKRDGLLLQHRVFPIDTYRTNCRPNHKM